MHKPTATYRQPQADSELPIVVEIGITMLLFLVLLAIL
jgi:hypothetical protein